MSPMVVIVVALAVWTISVAMASHKVPRSVAAAALLKHRPQRGTGRRLDRHAQQKQALTAQDGNGC